MRIVNIPINKIKPDSKQPRQTIDHEKISDMAKSMKTTGVINPIEIDKHYTIVTGEMRWRAAKAAELQEIPCRVINVSNAVRFRRQVIENIHHNTMTDWDTAKALHKLLKELPITPGSIGTHGGQPNKGYSELGKLIGKSQQYVGEKLELLGASAAFRKAVQRGLSGTFIRALNATPETFKKKMESKIISGEFKTRDVALFVAQTLKKNPDKGNRILALNYSAYKAVPTVENALAKIALPLADQIDKTFIPPEQLHRIWEDLQGWMKHNQPQTVGAYHLRQIILTLSVMQDAIAEWVKPVTKKIPQLEKGKS